MGGVEWEEVGLDDGKRGGSADLVGGHVAVGGGIEDVVAEGGGAWVVMKAGPLLGGLWSGQRPCQWCSPRHHRALGQQGHADPRPLRQKHT